MSMVKTAISVEENLFSEAERAAKEMQVSRSRLFAMALKDYLERRDAVELVKSYDEAYAADLNEEERTGLIEAEDAHWAARESDRW